MDLRISEYDEAGRAIGVYVCSKSGDRIDFIRTKEQDSLWTRLLNVFLPAGYPHSVTSDYLWYQIYDSLQAFASSIAGLLSSRAVLQGVGVGDASASPTAALLLSVIQESMGRIATILFAHRLGTSLEPECKMYRLAADVFNDMAMISDCLSPALPKALRLFFFSFSSVLRALCGVAAGSSKASLSAHFAKWGNLGELNAEGIPPHPFHNPFFFISLDYDIRREIVRITFKISTYGQAEGLEPRNNRLTDRPKLANRIGNGSSIFLPSYVLHELVMMLAGSVVVSYVSAPIATWSCLIVLLSVHLAMNYGAVRAVSLHTLNRQRANILLSNLLVDNRVMTPDEVSAQEHVFEWDGVLRWKGSLPFAQATIGVSLHTLLKTSAPAHTVTDAIRDDDLIFERLVKTYSNEDFLVWYDSPKKTAYIILKGHASANAQLKAWALALWGAYRLENQYATGANTENVFQLLEITLRDISNQWDESVQRIKAAGWDVGIANLETSSGSRIRITA